MRHAARLLRCSNRALRLHDAARSATPESREAFEREYGTIEMEACIICPPADGGWVEQFDLLDDGTVKRTFYPGGSPEAEQIRLEVRQGAV